MPNLMPKNRFDIVVWYETLNYAKQFGTRKCQITMPKDLPKVCAKLLVPKCVPND